MIHLRHTLKSKGCEQHNIPLRTSQECFSMFVCFLIVVEHA